MPHIDGNDVKILEDIAQGASAHVHRANVTFGDGQSEDYALRVSHLPKKNEDPRFGQEAYLLEGKRIHGAVPVFGPFTYTNEQDEEHLATISPIVPGQTLFASHGIGYEQHPAGETAKIISQLATTLHETDKAGLVHNDIKPANLMYVADNERAFVIDWGAANKTGEFTEQWTPQYASPQVAQDQLSDIKNDIYAVGLIADEMMSGESARDIDTKLHKDQAKLDVYISNFKFNPKTEDDHMRAIIHEATQQDIEKRASPLDVVSYTAAYPEARNKMRPETQKAVMSHLVEKASNLETRHAALDAAAARGLLQESYSEPHKQHLEAISQLDTTYGFHRGQSQQQSFGQSVDLTRQPFASTSKRG